MSTQSQAELYADRFGKTADEKSSILKAVLYGQTLFGLEKKIAGYPITNKAFDYAMSFKQLTTEEKFRLQQAVKFGATLPPDKQQQSDVIVEFDDNSIMPFGKHKGKSLANVPAPYFLWLLNEGCSHAGIKRYILDNLEGLKQEAGQSKVRY